MENDRIDKEIQEKIKIEVVRELDLEEIKKMYIIYLEGLGWSRKNIDTAILNCFFIWKKSGRDMFWNIVLDIEFDILARRELKFLLDIRNTKGINSKFGDYMFQLQHFRQFVIEEFDVEKLGIRKVSYDNKKFEERYEIELPTPSNEELLIYLSKQKNIKEYDSREKALERLFEKVCLENKDIEDIFIKVSAIDSMYEIDLRGLYKMAKHIEGLEIDNRLKAGDITIIDDICKGKKGKVNKNCYSFATKYCGYHKPYEYPMYDEYAEEILKYFRDRDGFAKFKDDDLRDYTIYKGIIIDFRKYYKIENYSFKNIVDYMCQLGREFFQEKA